MMRYFKVLVVLCLLVFCACNNEDKKAQASQKPTELYLDYQVSAEEDGENAIVLLQFRIGGAEGKAVALEKGSLVTFDGEPVAADSAKMAGVYYEIQRPLADFAGVHRIVFKDKGGETFEAGFIFNPIELATSDSFVSRDNLLIEVAGISNNSSVQVTVTDTSFETVDINNDFKVMDGKIDLGKASPQQLISGPIQLELHKEEVKKLANGRLLIRYSVGRELELKD